MGAGTYFGTMDQTDARWDDKVEQMRREREEADEEIRRQHKDGMARVQDRLEAVATGIRALEQNLRSIQARMSGAEAH